MDPINTIEEFYNFLDSCIDTGKNFEQYCGCENIVLNTINFDPEFYNPFLNRISIIEVRYTKLFNSNAAYINLYCEKAGSTFFDCIYYSDTKLICKGGCIYIFDSNNTTTLINKLDYEKYKLISDIFSEIVNVENNFKTLLKTIINNEYYDNK